VISSNVEIGCSIASPAVVGFSFRNAIGFSFGRSRLVTRFSKKSIFWSFLSVNAIGFLKIQAPLSGDPASLGHL